MIMHEHLQYAGVKYASSCVQINVSVYIRESLDNVEASTCTSQNQVWQRLAQRECLDSVVEDSGDECHPTATAVKERCQAIGKILLESQGLSLLGLP